MYVYIYSYIYIYIIILYTIMVAENARVAELVKGKIYRGDHSN